MSERYASPILQVSPEQLAAEEQNPSHRWQKTAGAAALSLAALTTVIGVTAHNNNALIAGRPAAEAGFTPGPSTTEATPSTAKPDALPTQEESKLAPADYLKSSERNDYLNGVADTFAQRIVADANEHAAEPKYGVSFTPSAAAADIRTGQGMLSKMAVVGGKTYYVNVKAIKDAAGKYVVRPDQSQVVQYAMEDGTINHEQGSLMRDAVKDTNGKAQNPVWVVGHTTPATKDPNAQSGGVGVNSPGWESSPEKEGNVDTPALQTTEWKTLSRLNEAVFLAVPKK